MTLKLTKSSSAFSCHYELAILNHGSDEMLLWEEDISLVKVPNDYYSSCEVLIIYMCASVEHIFISYPLIIIGCQMEVISETSLHSRLYADGLSCLHQFWESINKVFRSYLCSQKHFPSPALMGMGVWGGNPTYPWWFKINNRFKTTTDSK